MRYRVINKHTGEDITNTENWVVTPDGKLYFCDYDSLTGDPDAKVDWEVDDFKVVRCKDCDVPHNKYTGCPKLGGLVTPPDFYCAFGRPKITENIL